MMERMHVKVILVDLFTTKRMMFLLELLVGDMGVLILYILEYMHVLRKNIYGYKGQYAALLIMTPQ